MGRPALSNRRPRPIDFHNYEFYTFASSDGTALETDIQAPAIEFNWGACPTSTCIIVPLAAIFPSNSPKFAPSAQGPNAYGIGDIETGVKYRFIQEGKHRPMVGTFVMFELPAGNYKRGLGIGNVWHRLPIWAQKSWGPWTTYGGVGETVVPQTGYRNFTYGGWLVQRDFGKKLTLGTELSRMAPKDWPPRRPKPPRCSMWVATITSKNPRFSFCSATATASRASPRTSVRRPLLDMGQEVRR